MLSQCSHHPIIFQPYTTACLIECHKKAGTKDSSLPTLHKAGFLSFCRSFSHFSVCFALFISQRSLFMPFPLAVVRHFRGVFMLSSSVFSLFSSSVFHPAVKRDDK